MTITAIIPFFAGPRPEQSVEWLDQTISSIRFANDVIVGVQNPDDLRRVQENFSVDCRVFNCSPMLLPVTLLRHVQTMPDLFLVLFTEADQVMNINNLASITKAIDADHNRVIAPHRAVQIQGNEPADWWGWGHWDHDAKRHRYLYERFMHEGREYVVHNRPHVLDTAGLDLRHGCDAWGDTPGSVRPQGPAYHFAMKTQIIDNMWYTNSNTCFAFGASWLMHADTFRRVEFKDQTQYALEESSFAVSRCPGVTMLKTLNAGRFFADHISHRFGNQSTWR